MQEESFLFVVLHLCVNGLVWCIKNCKRYIHAVYEWYGTHILCVNGTYMLQYKQVQFFDTLATSQT